MTELLDSLMANVQLARLEWCPHDDLSAGLDRISPGASRVYLSPHHDDIVLSLGNFVRTHPGGLLINLFSRSNYLSTLPVRFDASEEEIVRVTNMRAAEDTAFAEAVELKRIDLGRDDPPVLGRHPRVDAHLEEDVAQLDGLLELLRETATSLPAPRLLFCPVGIGLHSNHVATMQYVLRNRVAIEDDYTIAFYEDLPYATRHRARAQGLTDLLRLQRPRQPTRLEGRMDRAQMSEKLKLVGLYKSQLQLVLKDRQITPRAWRPKGPHEAVWLFR